VTVELRIQLWSVHQRATDSEECNAGLQSLIHTGALVACSYSVAAMNLTLSKLSFVNG
jgi:hypothetical protein